MYGYEFCGISKVPKHWKIWFLYDIEILRAIRFQSSCVLAWEIIKIAILCENSSCYDRGSLHLGWQIGFMSNSAEVAIRGWVTLQPIMIPSFIPGEFGALPWRQLSPFSSPSWSLASSSTSSILKPSMWRSLTRLNFLFRLWPYAIKTFSGKDASQESNSYNFLSVMVFMTHKGILNMYICLDGLCYEEQPCGI